MADDQAAHKSRISIADLVALSAVGLVLSAAILYSFGFAARTAYFRRMKFDAYQFPIDVLEVHLWGWGVGLGFIGLIILLTIVFYALRKWLQPFKGRGGLLVIYILGPILIWETTFLCVGKYADWLAREDMEKIKEGTSPRPKLALVREGTDKPFCPPGVRIICSERFCGFHDGEHATVVSLEGIRSIRTELPAECPAAPPEKAAP